MKYTHFIEEGVELYRVLPLLVYKTVHRKPFGHYVHSKPFGHNNLNTTYSGNQLESSC